MKTNRSPRIFYCGMVNTSRYAATIAEALHIGAAANKMAALVCAMRETGAKAYLVSIPILGQQARNRYLPTIILKHRDGPQIFLPIFANRYARKIYTLFGFAWFCVAGVGKNDRVVIYNHAFEYMLGSLILALRCNRAILDIEDAPRQDELGWGCLVGRTLFFYFNLVTKTRKIIVSHALAEALGLQKYCVVYGATRRGRFSTDLHRPLCGKPPSVPVKIHFGGSLTADTGLDLFCGAVDLLLDSVPHDVCQVQFVITGFGSGTQIRALKTRCAGTGVSIAFLPNLSPDKYLDELRRCHAALSLKLPESEIAMTTFPSKVVEITSHGLLLISTKASDVARLFDASNAVLLSVATPEALANAIMSVIENSQTMQLVAKQGQERAFELFESKNVGERIVNFIMDPNA